MVEYFEKSLYFTFLLLFLCLSIHFSILIQYSIYLIPGLLNRSINT